MRRYCTINHSIECVVNNYTFASSRITAVIFCNPNFAIKSFLNAIRGSGICLG